MERRCFAGFPSAGQAAAPPAPTLEDRPLVVSTARENKAYLRLDGRSPIPLAFRARGWLRSDGSLIVEGTASAEEDLALMIGARGRINMNDDGAGIGVRIAATDHERGVVRFLVQTRGFP